MTPNPINALKKCIIQNTPKQIKNIKTMRTRKQKTIQNHQRFMLIFMALFIFCIICTFFFLHQEFSKQKN